MRRYNRAAMRQIALLSLLFLAACGELKQLPTDPGGPVEPIDPTATFTRVQTEIFTPNCTGIGCHDPLGRQEGMVLIAGQAYANIVNRPATQNSALNRIQPGDPDNSYLYRKILGAGINGERMPQGGPYLNDAQIQLVRNWIRRGAPND